MKRLLRQPLLVGLAVFVGLIVMGNSLVVLTGSPPSDIDALGLTQAMMPVRMGLYAVIVALWDVIATLMARPRADSVHRDLSQEKIEERQVAITDRLKALRWRVACFFALFELLFIQRVLL